MLVEADSREPIRLRSLRPGVHSVGAFRFCARNIQRGYRGVKAFCTNRLLCKHFVCCETPAFSPLRRAFAFILAAAGVSWCASRMPLKRA